MFNSPVILLGPCAGKLSVSSSCVIVQLVCDRVLSSECQNDQSVGSHGCVQTDQIVGLNHQSVSSYEHLSSTDHLVGSTDQSVSSHDLCSTDQIVGSKNQCVCGRIIVTSSDQSVVVRVLVCMGCVLISRVFPRKIRVRARIPSPAHRG